MVKVSHFFTLNKGRDYERDVILINNLEQEKTLTPLSQY